MLEVSEMRLNYAQIMLDAVGEIYEAPPCHTLCEIGRCARSRATWQHCRFGIVRPLLRSLARSTPYQPPSPSSPSPIHSCIYLPPITMSKLCLLVPYCAAARAHARQVCRLCASPGGTMLDAWKMIPSSLSPMPYNITDT